jgi:hypothetical protein
VQLQSLSLCLHTIYATVRLNIRASGSARRNVIYLNKKKQSETIKLQSSIVNNLFPEKSGFTFCYNQLVRVGLKMLFLLKKQQIAET